MDWINRVVEFISQGWFGSVLGLLGLAVAVLTYILSRQRKRISFSYINRRLLGSNYTILPEEISVTYEGHQITQLSRLVLMLWNSGEKTVSAADVVKADPIRFDFGEAGGVLSAAVIKQSRSVVDAKAIIAMDTNTVVVEFEFLDPNDGLVVEVLHSGPLDEFEVYGTVKGLPKGLKNLGKTARQSPVFGPDAPRFLRSFLMPNLLGWATLLCGLGFAATGIFGTKEFFEIKIIDMSPGAISLAGGVVYILTGTAMLYRTRRKHPKSLLVEGSE